MVKVSIIIATLNNDKDLAYTLENVSKQNYKNKELIIIDGGSSDGTVELLKKNNKNIDHWKSEKDKGISDAFNKGLSMTSGDYIYFLGAGDYFWSEDALEIMMKNVNPKTDVLICGRINRTTKGGDKILYTSSLNFKKWHLLYKMGLPHQGLFMNKKYFITYGLFDTNYKYSMDYELLLRAYHNFPEVILKDTIVAAWKEGGIGEDKTLEIFDEYKEIKIKNKIAPNFLINLIDLISRIKYILIKHLRCLR